MKEEYDLDKVEKCWKVLNEFSMAELANSSEDIVELNIIKNEMLKKEITYHIDKIVKDKIASKKNSQHTVDSLSAYIIKKYEKDVPD
ncbi:hypothetical protein MNBD_DELTA01-1357 [hydrothermal vent metagenome]|uniref:Uncharacterized protein n=1 Tax=hydrothermal vent metagenome TaxID=652676 RepID=A0A3B0QW36_9ZZZZ